MVNSGVTLLKQSKVVGGESAQRSMVLARIVASVRFFFLPILICGDLKYSLSQMFA